MDKDKKIKDLLILALLILGLLIFTSITSTRSKQAKSKSQASGVSKVKIENDEDHKMISHLLEEDLINQQEQEKQERELDEKLALEKEKRIYNKYINNSLPTGATPYLKQYGRNLTCNGYGCSKIKISTSHSDVLAIIKKDNKVVKHAFIRSNYNYSFSFPNGTYQAFFYYGKGWNPNKLMKKGKLKGGFISNEYFSKDYPQHLVNNILEYKLILQKNGNFSTKSSSESEAL